MRLPGHQTLAVLLLSFACEERRFVALDAVPPEVELVALIAGAPNGSTHRATGLVTRDHLGEGALELEASPDELVRVLGYQRRALEEASSGTLAEEVIARDPLRIASCQASLPDPVWVGLVEEEGIREDRSQVPSLTAEWLRGVNPALRDLLVDVRCARDACLSTISQVGCEFSGDLSQCLLPPVEGVLLPDGTISFDGRGEAHCTEGPAPGEARARASCTFGTAECDIDFYDRGAPPFEVESITIREVSFLPDTDSLSQIVRGHRGGYLADVALIGDDLIVISRESPNLLGGERTCNRNAPRTFHRYDAQTLSLEAEAEFPYCVERVLPDPGGGAFLAPFGVWPELFVGRFDGESLALTSSKASAASEHPSRLFPYDFAISPEGTHLAVVYWAPIPGTTSFTAILELLSLPGLEEEGTMALEDRNRQISAIAFAREDLLVLADERTDYLLWVSVPDLALREQTPVPHSRSVVVDDIAVLGTRVVISVPADEHFLALFDVASGRSESFGTFFERTAAPMMLAPSGKPDELVVSALTLEPTQSGGRSLGGVVALFDASRGRFRPGLSALGHGPTGRLLLQKDTGRVFTILPWAAELLRLTPR